MRRSESAFPVAFVGVVAMFASGCAPSGPQRSCRSNDFLECVDYVEGFTDEGAIFLCDASTSTYSGSSSCPGGRAAHCTYVTDGFITGTVVLSWYSISPEEQARDCAMRGGDFVSDI